VPRIVGDTAEARAVKGERKPIDRETLLERIRGRSEQAADAARALLDWADEKELKVHYAPGSAAIDAVSADEWLLRVSVKGNIRLGLATLRGDGDHERIQQLVESLGMIGVKLDPAADKPKVPVEVLADDRRQRFFELMERAHRRPVGGGGR
jgi:hypothetical protein